MGKKQYWNSETKNQRWIKEGRGQGTGSNYKPWFTIKDVASQGRSHRVSVIKTLETSRSDF